MFQGKTRTRVQGLLKTHTNMWRKRICLGFVSMVLRLVWMVLMLKVSIFAGGGGASHENKPRTENPTFVPIVVPSPSYKTLPRSHGVVGDLDIFGAV